MSSIEILQIPHACSTRHTDADFSLEARPYLVDLGDDAFAACTEGLDRCETTVRLDTEESARLERVGNFVSAEEDTWDSQDSATWAGCQGEG
jgi:hypothetical protein